MDGLRGDEASPVLLAIHISCRHRRCRSVGACLFGVYSKCTQNDNTPNARWMGQEDKKKNC